MCYRYLLSFWFSIECILCDFNSCKFDKDDIVKISPVKSMQEIKSISPIKSIEEVVGIYALTEDQARRLKDLSRPLAVPFSKKKGGDYGFNGGPSPTVPRLG